MPVTAFDVESVAVDPDLVAQYVEALVAGKTLIPLLVFCDGDTYCLAGPAEPLVAARAAGLDEVPVVVERGTRRDAAGAAAGIAMWRDLDLARGGDGLLVVEPAPKGSA